MREPARKVEEAGAPVYRDNSDHIMDELRKLNLLIKRRVMALRLYSRNMPKTAAANPMYISHDEVDWLLARDDPGKIHTPEMERIDWEVGRLGKRIDASARKSAARGIFLALPQLAYLFDLSPFERQTVVICLAPELERKYDKLYAYLQDDITRKKPSVDLVLDLLCRTETERWRARSIFSGSTNLFRAGLLHVSDDPQSPSGSSGLAQFLRLDKRILGFILGDNAMDASVRDFVRHVPPFSSMDGVLMEPSLKRSLLHLCRRHLARDIPGRKKLVIHLQGPYGVGKRELALGICGELRCPMLILDMDLLPADDNLRGEVMQAAFREGLLHQAAIYVANVDAALKEDESGNAVLKKIARLTEDLGWLIFLAGERSWPGKGIFQGTVFHAVELPVPDFHVRKTAWESALRELSGVCGAEWADNLAGRFRLTPGRIREAAEHADLSRGDDDPQRGDMLADLFRSCRDQSNRKLGELARKIEPRYCWDDLVLPENRLAQLKEICCQVRNHNRVFCDWGFDRKLSHGRGLSALFSGPSGTGKTMGAEVIAHELRLDLYKIDLSRVVSKYIGETEKNLSKVFQEAETSNAVLFFDEADALFGKRTEVSDAHDRYANIETSYLLQKMEEYEGVVILATNLRENMDEAFTRRIRFIVEFPFPDEPSRSRIWRKHFPRETPVSDAIDYDFLARRYQIAGGSIRNIVLSAAFLAADDGGIIGMEHILHGTKREFEKIGKLWTGNELCKPLGGKNEGRRL